jgi:hypothetical protein
LSKILSLNAVHASCGGNLDFKSMNASVTSCTGKKGKPKKQF